MILKDQLVHIKIIQMPNKLFLVLNSGFFFIKQLLYMIHTLSTQSKQFTSASQAYQAKFLTLLSFGMSLWISGMTSQLERILSNFILIFTTQYIEYDSISGSEYIIN